jgi:anaerobic selenocysteine-containing dehydrogenase
VDTTVATTCGHNCGGRARLLCTVRDGRLTKVEPAPHPDPSYTGACVRCLSLPGWVYSPNRIREPMRRVGPRGSGEWEPISWADALDSVAQALTDTRSAHGDDAVAFTRTSGSSQLANYGRLQAAIGATQLFGSVDMAVHMGLNSSFGFKGMFHQGANEWTDRVNARTIIVWGHNPAETSMTLFRWLLDARDAGSKLIVIDTRHSPTAVHADWWVAPRPGTDTALALGMAHVIVRDGLIDESFLSDHTCGPLLVDDETGAYLRSRDEFVGWDAAAGVAVPDGGTDLVLDAVVDVAGRRATTCFRRLVDLLSHHDPERTSEITGIDAADVIDLAHVYATQTPSTIAYGYGIDRYVHGDVVTRSGAMLAMLTGNLGRPGASVGVASHGLGFHTNAAFDTSPRALGSSIPNSHVGQRPLAVRAVFSVGDHLNQRIADQNRAREWFGGLDFLAVVDHVWNTTAEVADIVLPACTYLEGEPGSIVDLQAWGNGVYLKRAVIEPLHQSRPDRWIEEQLATCMGIDLPITTPADEVRSRLDESDDPTLSGITLGSLEAAGGALRTAVPDGPNVQYSDLRFGTPSGRAEFYIESLAPIGQALPVYLPDHEAAVDHPAASGHPLVLTQSHARQRAHSTFSHNPWLLELWPEPVVALNPADARSRGIADGDLVEVRNARGSVQLRAESDSDQPPGVCNITEGWKHDQFAAGHLQELVNGEINPAQELIWNHSNLPFSDTRVEVQRVEDADNG